jgi:ethanolamine permease
MYILSMLALFRLRRLRPDMERHYKAPFYPVFPAFALVGSVVCMGTMLYYNRLIALLFAGLLGSGFIYFLLTRHQRERAAD